MPKPPGTSPQCPSCDGLRKAFLHWAVRMRGVWRKEGKRAVLRALLRTVLAPRYETWIAGQEPGASRLAEQRSTAPTLAYRPLISIVVGARAIPPQWIEASIRSIADQSYDRWELDLVQSSEDASAKLIAETWAARDSRVRIHRADALPPPPLLQRGRGDFVMRLGAGDTLAAHALFEIVDLLNRRADTDLIYFDEDRLSNDGRRRGAPFFKPDWSPELLCSVNYLAHAVVRRRLVDQLPASAERAEDASEWDVLLRCTEQTRAIAHIPQVLYHQRTIAGTAGRSSDDLTRSEDHRRCLAGHLERHGATGARALLAQNGQVRVTWPPAGARVSIIIPNRDRVPVLQRCITGLLERTSYRNFEILIVDTGSAERTTRDYYTSLTAYAQIRIVDHPGPFNFSAANNAGVRHATGGLLLFLNNDTEPLEPDWLEEMVRWAERPEIGIVGAKLLYPDGMIQHAGVILGLNGLAEHIYRYVHEGYCGVFGSVDWYRNYMAVTAACMMTRREVFDEVGGFDEAYEVAFSDFEFCLRAIEYGYRVLYTPFARLLHHEGATRGQHTPSRDTRRAIDRMKGLIASGDPYFNPNLSAESPVPTLPSRGDRSRTALLARIISRLPP